MRRALIIIMLIFMLMISSLSVSAQLADSPWPTYKGNQKRTGLSNYTTNIDQPHLKWKFDAGQGIETSVVIGEDGTLYFGAYKNYFFALNPDGTEKWRLTREGEEFRSNPMIDEDGIIYFGAVYDLKPVYNILHQTDMEYGIPKVYALYPNGTVKWEFVTGGILAGTLNCPTMGADGTIYMGSGGALMTDYAEGGNRFWAVNPDGTEKWHFDTGEVIYSGAAIDDDGTIYFGCADQNVYALTPEGEEIWRFTIDEEGFCVFDATPTIGSDGTIYASNTNRNLYALNPEDGTEIWHFTVSDLYESTVSIGSDGTIYSGVIDQSETDRNVYAINPDGTEKWRFETGDGVCGTPAIDADGIIYFGSYDKYLYALYPDGTEKWRYELGGPVVVSPTIDSDGTIYVGTWDNHLYAIDGSATDNEAVDDEDTDSKNNDGTGTPGFELILIILAITIVIYARRKKTC